MNLEFLKKDIQIKRVSEGIDKKLEKIINLLIWYIVIVNPFIVLFLNGNFIVIDGMIIDCYSDLKVLILWIVAAILIIIFLIKREFKFDSIEKFIIIFLGIIAISTVASLNPIISLWGNQGRREGFFTFCAYTIIFIMAKRYLVVSNKRVNVLLVAGVIMSIYGIFQFWGIDPITSFFKLKGETVGTIGHRNFFSSYLIILLAISISGYILMGIKKWFIYSNFYFAALICTLTRGGWLSLGFFCLIGLIFVIKRKDAHKRVMILVLSFVAIFGVLGFVSGDRVFGRVKTIKDNVTNISEESGTGRVYIWKVTSKVIKKYPLLGTGPEALSTSIVKDFEDDIIYWRKNFEPTFIDKAHNEMLNIAATTGIFSLIIYISLLFVIIKGLIKKIENDNVKVLFIMIIAYITQSMFNISVVAVAPIFWVTLAIASRVKYNKDIFSGKEIEL